MDVSNKTNKKIRVAINGVGRIGRAFIRLAQNAQNSLSATDNNLEIEIVAVNDLAGINNIAYLLKYDTVYGSASFPVSVDADFVKENDNQFDQKNITDKGASKKNLIINNKKVIFFSEKEPTNLPWKDLNIDVVIESSGVFATFEKAKAHISAGAKKVIITAPVKDAPSNETEATILMGINNEKLEKCIVSSNASCTTNAGAPLMQILNEKIGIEKAILSTVHGLTASQSTVDGPNKKDWKEGRAGAFNIVPTSTGAAIAVTKAIPELENKFDGIAMRVPISVGSIADITFISKRNTTKEEVNQILKEASLEERWQGIFAVTEDQLVSSDIIGTLFGSIADLGLTKVVDGNLVKVCAWYDNEMGYTATLIKHTLEMSKYL